MSAHTERAKGARYCRLSLGLEVPYRLGVAHRVETGGQVVCCGGAQEQLAGHCSDRADS